MATSEKSPMLPTRAHESPARTPLLQRLRQPRTLIALTIGVFLVTVLVMLSVEAIGKTTTTLSAVPTAFPAKPDGTRDLLQFCEEKFVTQELDHFRANGGGGSFEQRYFVCSRETFKPTAAEAGAIFLYVGNEADVELYLNNTGLMWENAAAFNALVVFAEHRYFGKSVPFGDHVLEHMEFLSSTQALADFAVLVEHLKASLDADVPVIGFGGSYGGMLATWLRLKYPHIVDGVIAASAPVLHFLGDKDQPVDWEGFQRVVTFDMSAQAGSAPNCIPNVRRALVAMREMGQTTAGRKELASIFRLCDADGLQTDADVEGLVLSTLGTYGALAMGNYPYPSSYMTSGASFLPAYPVRAACDHLKDDFGETESAALLAGLRESVGVFLNSSKRETCFFPPAPPASETTVGTAGNFWFYLECAELYVPLGSDGVHDILPPLPLNTTAHDDACFAQWGVHVRPDYAHIEYGGLKALRAASNIVFSNGDFDPWSATGVLASLSDSVVYVPVPGGAHHLDLFFSHPLDPPAVTHARDVEKQHIRQWIDAFYASRSRRQQ